MKTKQTTEKKRVTAAAKRPTTLSGRVAHHTKKLLVPHKANDYRPHLVRLHGIIAVLGIALVAQVAYTLAATGTFGVMGRAADISTVELLTDTNAEREAQGLRALTLNDQLSQAAYLKGQDMLANDYWAHVSPSGVEPWKWFGDAGYNYSTAGENLAKNYPDAEATVAAWMNSETHRANILNDTYQDVGFAVVEGELQGKEATVVVALYGAPVTVAAVAEQTVNRVQPAFSASAVSQNSDGPLEYFGSAVGSLSPVTVMTLGLLGLVAIVGVSAHHYRAKLPKAWKKSWRLHHGLYTFLGMISLGVLVILASGTGQL